MARIIVFIIFGGFGLVMLYVGVTQMVTQRRLLANAERVDAVIVHSDVFSSTSSDDDSRPLRSTSTTTHRPDVKFRYRVKGKVARCAGSNAAKSAAAPNNDGASVNATGRACRHGIRTGSARGLIPRRDALNEYAEERQARVLAEHQATDIATRRAEHDVDSELRALARDGRVWFGTHRPSGTIV
jgi:Protein of unknown function (DUF3592)